MVNHKAVRTQQFSISTMTRQGVKPGMQNGMEPWNGLWNGIWNGMTNDWIP